MTAAERRQAILEALCVRRHDTRENLAFEFGVSKRTIEYDVLELSLSYPIYTIQGHGGGIFVDDDFYLHKAYMTEQQLGLLEEILPTLSGKKREIMQSILFSYGGRKHRKQGGKNAISGV